MSSTNRRVAAWALALTVVAAHWMVGSTIWKPTAKPGKRAIRSHVVSLRLQAVVVAPDAVESIVSRHSSAGADTARSTSIEVRKRITGVRTEESMLSAHQAAMRVTKPTAATESPSADMLQSLSPAGQADAKAKPADPPRYAASAPEPARLAFIAMRGEQRLGEAAFDWQRQGDRYSVSMRVSDGAVDDHPLMSQTSVGRVNEHGLQPERFVDFRKRRGARAVNLRCDEGVVSYSASSVQHACVGGMQDGLSWWVQLAAIVSAMPAKPAEGSELQIAVARAHGSIDIWTFEVQRQQSVDQELADDAGAEVIRLVRRPGRDNRAYDTYAEVWLDATAPHWPRRVQLQEARGEPLIWVRR